MQKDGNFSLQHRTASEDQRRTAKHKPIGKGNPVWLRGRLWTPFLSETSGLRRTDFWSRFLLTDLELKKLTNGEIGVRSEQWSDNTRRFRNFHPNSSNDFLNNPSGF